MVYVHISEEIYFVGLEECKTHLHERILLTKGDRSFTRLELCKKIDLTWKHLGQWKAIQLGKWFYEFAFSSSEDI